MEQITDLAVAAVVASGGLIPLLRSAASWWSRKRHEKGLRSIRRIYSNINTLSNALDANRVAILDVCNGGHAPKAGSKLTIQTVYEISAIETPCGRTIGATKAPVDPDLLDRIIKLSDGDPHSWATVDMPDGTLRLLAESMDSDKVVMHRVGVDVACTKVLAVFMPTDSELTPRQEQLLWDTSCFLRTLRW